MCLHNFCARLGRLQSIAHLFWRHLRPLQELGSFTLPPSRQVSPQRISFTYTLFHGLTLHLRMAKNDRNARCSLSKAKKAGLMKSQLPPSSERAKPVILIGFAARSNCTCLCAPSSCRWLLSLSRSVIQGGSRHPRRCPRSPGESWTV